MEQPAVPGQPANPVATPPPAPAPVKPEPQKPVPPQRKKYKMRAGKLTPKT